MPLPLLIILGPLIPAVVLFLISRRFPLIAGIVGGISALILRILIASEPISTDPGEWDLMGRALVLSGEHYNLLLFLYSAAIILFFLAALWPQGAEFIPIGFTLLAVSSAALMMQPVSFGIVLLLVIISLSAALLQSGRAGIAHGPLWYLLFTALGVPLCLLAAWMLISQPGALFGNIWRLLLVGLLLLLAGFPFLYWVRPVFRFAAPLPIVVALGLVPLIVLAIVLQLPALSPSIWMDSPIRTLLGQAGAITVGIATVLMLYARDWSSLLGYSLLADLGAVFLALSLSPAGIPLVGSIILLRTVSLLLGGIGLAQLQSAGRNPLSNAPSATDFSAGSGLAWKQPLGTLLFLLGTLSLVGFPLTPGFSGRWQLLTLLWSDYLPFALILILAMIGNLVGVVRAGRQLFGGPGRESFSIPKHLAGFFQPVQITQIVLLILLLTGLLLAFFPQILTSTAPLLLNLT